MIPFITLICASGIFLLDMGGVLKPFQQKAYDAMLCLKVKAERYGTGINVRQVSPAIVIVEIDDNTFSQNNFQIPQTLWHKYYAEVIKGIADANASVIGFDFLLPQALFDDLVPNYSHTWLKALAYANFKKIPVVTGYIDMSQRQILPHARYLQILGNSGVGLFNLTVDQDDFIRQQQLLFSTAHSGEKFPCFALLVASAYDKVMKRDIVYKSNVQKKNKTNNTILPESIYIDYKPSVFFQRYSFSQIYEKIISQDTSFLSTIFNEKIVLIGQTDALSQDLHATPLYYIATTINKRTYGIEINANIIQTIINRKFISDIPVLFCFLIYLLTAASIVSVTMISKNNWIVCHLAGMTLLHISVAFLAMIHYYIFPIAGGLCTIAVSQFLSFGCRYYIVDRAKRKIESVFQCYLPKKIVSQLLTKKENELFEGQEKKLCVIFTDIRNFTTFSENRAPAEVVARLNEYFEVMSSVIYSENGVVDKFLGDGILAFFGAFDDELSSENASMAGMQAALKMLTELDKLNEQWEKQHQEKFKIGIGMHTGKVMIGNIGSLTKMEYTVIGDAVNLASRLQDQTKVLQETIIFSDAVHKELKGKIMADSKGVVDIKGRSPVAIFALKGIGK